MEGEDTGCGAVILSQRQGDNTGEGNRNPTANAKSLTWESRVRRIYDRNGTEENKNAR